MSKHKDNLWDKTGLAIGAVILLLIAMNWNHISPLVTNRLRAAWPKPMAMPSRH